MTAINKMANEAGIADDERMKKVREARINSLDILRAKEKNYSVLYRFQDHLKDLHCLRIRFGFLFCH